MHKVAQECNGIAVARQIRRPPRELKMRRMVLHENSFRFFLTSKATHNKMQQLAGDSPSLAALVAAVADTSPNKN